MAPKVAKYKNAQRRIFEEIRKVDMGEGERQRGSY